MELVMASTESSEYSSHSLCVCQSYGLRITFGVAIFYVVVIILLFERSSIDIVVLSSDRNDTSSQACGVKTNKIVAGCLFRNYNDMAAISVKSRVLRRLSISNAIQIYKPGVPMIVYEDVGTRLRVNRTKLYHTKTNNNDRLTRVVRITDDLRLDTKRTCAVVSNGGILLDSGCGQEIDAHDFVIRSNIAEIKSFVHDVGSKTDIMTINAQRLRALVDNLLKNETTSSSREDFERLRFLNNSILWYVKNAKGSGGESVKRLYDILQYHHLPIKVAYSPEHQLPVTKKIWNIDFPTTGLMEYTFAAALCDRISLYGFYPFSKGMNRDAIQHHYFETWRKYNYKQGKHTFKKEYTLLTRLHWKGALRFTGDSCLRIEI